MALIAILENGIALKYLPKHFQDDKEIVSKAFTIKENWYSVDDCPLKFASERL